MEEKKRIIKYTPQQARLKMESYCAFQERSHFEVKEKLYACGLYSDDVNDILSHLIQNNFLNEERFACAYVTGKFRMKGWGRNKIKQGLKLKRVSDANIKIGLKQLDPQEYADKLMLLAEKKDKNIKEKNPLKKKFKLSAYLISKGYETDLVMDAIKQMQEQ